MWRRARPVPAAGFQQRSNDSRQKGAVATILRTKNSSASKRLTSGPKLGYPFGHSREVRLGGNSGAFSFLKHPRAARPRVFDSGDTHSMEQTITTARPPRRRTRPHAQRAALGESAAGLMHRAAFAKEHGVCDRTVARWCAAGLPHVRLGQMEYIVVAGARKWFAARAERRG